MSVDKRKQFERSVREILSESLRKDFNNSFLKLVSITRIEVNGDFSEANVYWDTFDNNRKAQITDAMEGVRGRLRSQLARKLKIRHTPELHLFYDEQFEAEQKIDQLLKS